MLLVPPLLKFITFLFYSLPTSIDRETKFLESVIIDCY